MKVTVILSEQVSEPVEVSVITPPKTPEICARIEGDEIHVEWTGISAAYELTFGNNGGIVKTTANDYFEGAIPGMTQSYTVVAVNLAGRSAPATTSITVPMKYVELPAAPVFASPNIINVPTAGLTVFASTLAGKQEHELRGTTTARIVLNGIGGTEDKPIKFKGDGKLVIGDGSQPSQRCVSSLNATDHVELHHLNVYSNDGGVMLSGSPTVKKTLKCEGLISAEHAFAGIWCNTSGAIYKSMVVRFCRAFNLFKGADGGEGRYLGNMDKSTIFEKYFEEHGYTENTGRESLQFTGVLDLMVRNFTAIESGVSNIGGQNRHWQLQYVNGGINNSIFDGGPALFEIFSHGVTCVNNYHRWKGNNGAYIGKAKAHKTTNGQPIVLDSFVMNPVNEVTNMMTIVEDACDVIIKNFIVHPNVKNPYLDNRIDKQSFKIKVENYVNAIPEPVTYMEEPENVWRKAKLVTSKYHLDRKMGYRTA